MSIRSTLGDDCRSSGHPKVRNERRLPEQRADLYDSIANWLARAREARPGREQSDRVLSLLGYLALGMQTQTKGRLTQVGRSAAAQIISAQFREAEDADSRLARARLFLEAEEMDSGILVSRGSQLRFWHLTLQEFLAARTIAGLTDSSQQQLLFEHDRLYQSEWHEVMLLLAGTLIGQGTDRVDGLFSAMLDRVGKEATLAEKARCVGLMGAMLTDLRPFSYNLPDNRYERILQEVLGIFDKEKSRGIDLLVRLAAAEALGQAGDPRLRLPKHQDYWVAIAESKLATGGSEHKNKSRHEVRPNAFLIGRYPVTVYEYALFLEDTEYNAPNDWENQSMHPNRPVVGVSWFDAVAYCRWAEARLPTELEWERAAGGTVGRRYPWGSDSPTPEMANYDETRIGAPSPVGLFPRGSTPEDIADLAGNVWEWVSDWSDETRDERRKAVVAGSESREYKCVRGGCWAEDTLVLRTTDRDSYIPENGVSDIGFRCVRDVFP